MKQILSLFLTFLKIGTFTFGGGYAMIPAIRRETVERHAWIGESDMADCIAVCQSLPGAFAINTAVFIGRHVKGVAGALAAVFGVVLPAFVSILAILLFLGSIENNVYVLGALEGIKAASVALVFVTLIQMGRSILKGWLPWTLAIASFLLIVAAGVSGILAILLGGTVGWAVHTARQRKGAAK